MPDPITYSKRRRALSLSSDDVSKEIDMVDERNQGGVFTFCDHDKQEIELAERALELLKHALRGNKRTINTAVDIYQHDPAFFGSQEEAVGLMQDIWEFVKGRAHRDEPSFAKKPKPNNHPSPPPGPSKRSSSAYKPVSARAGAGKGKKGEMGGMEGGSLAGGGEHFFCEGEAEGGDADAGLVVGGGGTEQVRKRSGSSINEFEKANTPIIASTPHPASRLNRPDPSDLPPPALPEGKGKAFLAKWYAEKEGRGE